MRKAGVEIPADAEQKLINILESQESKSSKMKKMFDLGLDIKEIAQVMEVRYNFVYNVISNYVNIEDIAVVKEPGESKKGQIIELFLNGRSNKEIAKELKLNYNYIYKVIREYNERHTPKPERVRQVVGQSSTPTNAVGTPVTQESAQESIQEAVTPEPVQEAVTQEAVTQELPPEVQQKRKQWGFLPNRR